MDRGNWSFQPRLIPALVTITVIAALIALGLWQLDRAKQKQSLFDQSQERGKIAVVDLSGLTARGPDELLWRRVSMIGSYHPGLTILLDNRIYQGRAGYDVFMPMQMIGSDVWILVNRGWVPAGTYRDSVPDIKIPAGQVVISGRIEAPPYSGILLNGEYIEKIKSDVLRTQSITPDKLGEITGVTFQPFIVRLDPGEDSGLIKDWGQPGSGKEKHLGYAFQWFAMAAIALFVYLYLNIKRAGSE